MNILAVDTTEDRLSLALKADEKTFVLSSSGKKPHDQTLLPGVERLLKKAKLKAGDLDAIAVARGPGRFTGIRIGMSFAAVAAGGLEIPALALTRLEAAAFKAGGERVCAAIPGWKDERAYQLFRRKGAALAAEGEASWTKAEDWPRARAKLEKEGWAVAEGKPGAADLLLPAERLLARRRTPKFEPLYLKPAGYENPARVVR